MTTPNGIQFPSPTSSSSSSSPIRRRTITVAPSPPVTATTTTTATAATTAKKRVRGRSLRSNVLLRSRRFSIPLPIITPSSAGDSSSDYSDYSSSDTSDAAAAAASSSSSSSSDDNDAYPAPSPAVVVAPPPEPQQLPPNELFWGWIVLLSTWVVFVVGMGSVVGVWEWAWYGGRQNKRRWPRSVGGERSAEFPIPGYYPALCILTCIVAWVWVVVAWVGMKYFKHAKIQS